ncbi:MAG: GNAT family N-acetyltransferase [Cyanobacteria bacterium P01_H01_bin.15]
MIQQPRSEYAIAWLEKLADIPQGAWDALAKPLATPFLEWAWLNNMETSGSVRPRTGWQPCHLSVWRDRQLVAAAPLYVKGHSYGEFVFDHQWADLHARLGADYYPKLLGMSPFTPAEGYRFLIAPGEDEDYLMGLMIQAIDQFCRQHRLSGCNFLFVDPEWQRVAERHGFTPWLHHSYIWHNQGFSDFSSYLSIFNSNQRKNIKRERKAVDKAGLQVKTFAAEEIPAAFFPLIYRFYSSTCDKFYWGSKYLTKRFFEQLNPTFRDRVLLIAAYNSDRQERPVGLSFCLRKGDRLYGRYWGCLKEYDALHFEACYYKPIEWAIQEGCQIFDPGAGGQHKKRRGFPATPNYSLHRFYDPRASQILQTYIGQINELEQQEIDAINQELPFTKREIELSLD